MKRGPLHAPPLPTRYNETGSPRLQWAPPLDRRAGLGAAGVRMRLSLNPNSLDEFVGGMPGIWMHRYRFDDSTITGYYKALGLGNLTFVNRQSSAADIEKMRRAYESIDHTAWPRFYRRMLEHIPEAARPSMTVADISSATGRNSILAVDAGFGRVTSSEIRPEQCAQQELVYRCLANPIYRDRITVLNDTVSADDEAFPGRYDVDVALSFGLLYHLANPVQHLVNLHRMVRHSAVVYTMTHQSMASRGMWRLTLEDPEGVTKATSSISWQPHYLDIPQLCRDIGFKSVTMLYPDVFEARWPRYAEYTRAHEKIDALLSFAGLRRGPLSANDPRLTKITGINPNYFAYVLTK